MSYYDTLANAETHPLRVAYQKFETDKAACILTMKCNEGLYKGYVDAQERLQRLKLEQMELLKIMPDDLTADLLVERLTKS